ncbi:hypothetical protein BGX38DRAFT_1210415 [Terfezia claveryi]|nr:hypothetical protein BGX38DRAFT_1210415 [Terfezia claveryi]
MDQTVNQRTLLLLDRVSNDILTLNKRFENIITLAPIDGKDKNVTASEVFQIEVHATAMVQTQPSLGDLC